MSPGGSRISPGRLTLVKTTPGCPGTSQSPTHHQNAASAQYVQSCRPSHTGQYASPQVHQTLGPQQTQAQLMSSGGLMQTPTGSGRYLQSLGYVCWCISISGIVDSGANGLCGWKWYLGHVCDECISWWLWCSGVLVLSKKEVWMRVIELLSLIDS